MGLLAGSAKDRTAQHAGGHHSEGGPVSAIGEREPGMGRICVKL
jgi:hypothetical protein